MDIHRTMYFTGETIHIHVNVFQLTPYQQFFEHFLKPKDYPLLQEQR